ncbi:hypothetical protein DJ568_03000 [Mucilaginibacter hurinus]|uniref:Uncharacterized protein n=1 Tax=Mucilaginibacter hurinus TaxID=2201324 RepID=A0A367GUF5_9SPHI|nr:hypothetical protein [Mucilaginibacter hurinus]RCH56838.1 hypothetical protein DJ568_03000 [Mucilaginibacter hurinus]
MWFSDKKKNGAQVPDEVARSIAGRIVRVQKAASEHLNNRVNRYDRRTQLRWFLLGCFLALLAILSSVWVTMHHRPMPQLRSNAMPVHIGKSSDGIPLKPEPSKDSVNIKNKAYGNDK